jgi:hypothetical protein
MAMQWVSVSPDHKLQIEKVFADAKTKWTATSDKHGPANVTDWLCSAFFRSKWDARRKYAGRYAACITQSAVLQAQLHDTYV